MAAEIIDALRQSQEKCEQAVKLISEVWEKHQGARGSRIADVVNLLSRALAKLKLELKGRPATDEESKKAVDDFLNKPRGFGSK